MLLPITRKCNQKCLFCSVGDWKELVKMPTSREFLKWLIYQAKDGLTISGGEPTLSPNFLWAIEYARQGQIPVEVQTNSLTFSRKGFADSAVKAGADYFSVNFPSHISKINDQITRANGSFKKRMLGIKNLQRHNVRICLTHVICSLNYKHLEEFIAFVKNNFSAGTFIQFNFLKIMGFAAKNKQVLLSYENVIPYFLSALSKCKELGIDFVIDNMPICYFKNFNEHHIDVQKISRGEKLTYSLYEREKLNRCAGCRLSSRCCGVDKDYLRFFGKKSAVRPVR